jgi:EmrB/QacA subfamily drug resistance transporter
MVTFLVAMEGTVVSTAMPQTVAELGGADQLSWVFSAYLAGLAVTGPVWGSLADRIGSRSTYLLCVALFLLGCGWAAAAQDMTGLVLARALQGLGGGGLTPLGQTVLSQIYNRQERAGAQGWLVSAFALASLFGPLVGGYITEHLTWRWIFLLNLPFGLLGAGLLLLNFRAPAVPPDPPPFDWRGAFLFVLWMVFTLLWTDQLKDPSRWDESWPLAIAAGLAGVGLHRWCRRHPAPFLPYGLLKIPTFRGAVAVALLLGAALFGAVTYFPLFLQRQFQLGSSGAGQAMMPLLLTWVSASAIAPRLVLRYNYAAIVGLAAAALVLAYGSLAVSFGRPQVVLAQVALGLGGGLSFTPLTLAVQEVVPPEKLGQATAAVAFLRMLGATLGTALLGAALEGLGFRAMFWLGLALALAALAAWVPFRRSLRC